ncbi:MAG TPA: MFS transporter [Xanthobacteraceae bacterium]|nr:MFS transporter [Xanthobacteraceae bacterium]
MTIAIETPANIVSDDRLAKRNALVLAVAQALAGGNNAVIVATSGIAGASLAPDPGLATVPISAMVVGMWVGALPIGMMAKNYGRRFALQVGSVFGVLAGFVSCVAMLQGSFPQLILGTFCGGLYAAAHQSYRFAAADTASEAFRPKAISYVMAGGLFAAFVGAQLVIFTKDLWQPFLFAATYLGQAAVALLAAGVLVFLRIPKPSKAGHHEATARPLSEIARQSRFIVAVVCGVASYGIMNLIMTSAPLAMVVECGHSVTESTLGLQWHVLAMYGPSFFTGTLISRFGTKPVVGAGLGLIAASAIVGLLGTSVAHFWAVLILLGLGWNFGFIGATAMVTECHRPAERNKVQAFNDFLVFGSMAVTSFSSGKLLATIGWVAVNITAFPIILVAGTLLFWLALRPRPHAA